MRSLGALFWDERHGQGFSVLFLNEAGELSAEMHFPIQEGKERVLGRAQN